MFWAQVYNLACRTCECTWEERVFYGSWMEGSNYRSTNTVCCPGCLNILNWCKTTFHGHFDVKNHHIVPLRWMRTRCDVLTPPSLCWKAQHSLHCLITTCINVRKEDSKSASESGQNGGTSKSEARGGIWRGNSR